MRKQGCGSSHWSHKSGRYSTRSVVPPKLVFRICAPDHLRFDRYGSWRLRYLHRILPCRKGTSSRRTSALRSFDHGLCGVAPGRGAPSWSNVRHPAALVRNSANRPETNSSGRGVCVAEVCCFRSAEGGRSLGPGSQSSGPRYWWRFRAAKRACSSPAFATTSRKRGQPPAPPRLTRPFRRLLAALRFSLSVVNILMALPSPVGFRPCQTGSYISGQLSRSSPGCKSLTIASCPPHLTSLQSDWCASADRNLKLAGFPVRFAVRSIACRRSSVTVIRQFFS